MTNLFIATLVALVIFMLALAVGVMFNGKRLKGSCGGLGTVMGEDCMFCDNKDECEAEGEEDHECGPKIEVDAGRAFLSH